MLCGVHAQAGHIAAHTEGIALRQRERMAEIGREVKVGGWNQAMVKRERIAYALATHQNQQTCS